MEVESVLRIISAHIVRGPHSGILKILIEWGMAYLSRNFSGQLNDIYVPGFRTAMGQKSFAHRASVIWNSISHELKLCVSTKIFKRCLEKQLWQSFLEENC